MLIIEPNTNAVSDILINKLTHYYIPKERHNPGIHHPAGQEYTKTATEKK